MVAKNAKKLGSYEGIDIYERTWAKGAPAMKQAIQRKLRRLESPVSITIHRFDNGDGTTQDFVVLTQKDQAIVLSSGKAGVDWTPQQRSAWERGAFLLPASVALGKIVLAVKKVTIKLMEKAKG